MWKWWTFFVGGGNRGVETKPLHPVIKSFIFSSSRNFHYNQNTDGTSSAFM